MGYIILKNTADVTSLSNKHSVGNGSWVIAGVTTTDVTTSGNLTAIRCSSTHLTSFAVLVDVAGGLAVSACMGKGVTVYVLSSIMCTFLQ